MKMRFLLAVTALFCGATPLGAQEVDSNTGTSAEANAAPAKQPKAAPKSAATAKPKTKPKAKPKTKKKPAAKSKKPAKAPTVPRADHISEEERAAIAVARQQYKQDVAEWIGKTSTAKMHQERPQALLRSVVVLKFSVNAQGKVVKSSVRRSNRDREAEEAAMASLKEASPLPKPPAILVRHGPVEMHETWLFNKDGRFQIRSTAQKQMDH
ncbi:energy transducer TonB [Oxalobacteraceae bacterium R-40]|uniref:Energy transducer TonB n=1 Tax=Keguizhuia sedimenti TaxID=3064264 RepID=A0ABU1BUM5_9BURK|nr:energy transducer TonB [Oxalobacteraceae bacterium R-40]